MKENHFFNLEESSNLNENKLEVYPQSIDQEKPEQNQLNYVPHSIEQKRLAETPTKQSKKIHKQSTKTNPQSASPIKTPKLTKQRKLSKISNTGDKQKQKQRNPHQLFGHWHDVQNKRYHWFLQLHYSHFMNRSLRRMDRIFTSMAKFVGTREAEQCRSHHQKMEKKYKTFGKILLSLREIHYSGKKDGLLMKQDMEKNGVETGEDDVLTEEALLESMTNSILLMTPNNSCQSPRINLQDRQEKKPFIYHKSLSMPSMPEQRMEAIDFADDSQEQQKKGLMMEQQKQQFHHQNDEEGQNEMNYDNYHKENSQLNMWPLELESSKNCYFKLHHEPFPEKDPSGLHQDLQPSILMDEAYENKLDFNDVMF